LDESPSLKYELSAKILEAYEDGVFFASQETHLPQEDFPQEVHYTQEELLDDAFFPSR
jgi:Domain of unknown function DUF29.